MNNLLNNRHYLVALLSLIVLGVVLYLHFDTVVFQYLFYLRTPIIFSILLLILPILCIKTFKSLLSNFFVLDQLWKMWLVIAHAFVVAHGTVLLFGVIGYNAPDRFGIERWDWFTTLLDNSANTQFYVTFLLGFPIAFALWVFADLKPPVINNVIWQKLNRPVVGLIGGIAIAVVIFMVVSELRNSDSFIHQLATRPALELINLLPESAQKVTYSRTINLRPDIKCLLVTC